MIEPSPVRNLGKVSFTYRDVGSYGEFINTCRLAAWRMAIDRFALPRARVIDVGCSYGSWSDNWKQLGIGRTIGIDPNGDVIEAARGRLDEAYQCFASGLIERVSDEKLIAANAVLVHILEAEETTRFLSDVGRCLSEDGYFLYSVISAQYYYSAGRKEKFTELSCVRTLDTQREFARSAGLEIVAELGTFIDPWAIPDLEFLAGWLDRREDPALYRPFIELGNLIRGESLAPFSEVLMVTRRAG